MNKMYCSYCYRLIKGKYSLVMEYWYNNINEAKEELPLFEYNYDKVELKEHTREYFEILRTKEVN